MVDDCVDDLQLMNCAKYILKPKLKLKKFIAFLWNLFPQMVFLIKLLINSFFFFSPLKLQNKINKTICDDLPFQWRWNVIVKHEFNIDINGYTISKIITIVTNKCYTNSQNIWYGIWYVQEHLSCDMIELWISKCLWVSFYKLFEL
jgi:hypothetical protein